MRNISTRHYAATFICLAIGSAACADGPCELPEGSALKEEIATAEQAARVDDPTTDMECLTCDNEGGGVDIYIRGPSRWERDNIRRWLDADRREYGRERHTSPVRETPGEGATPKGIEATPDPGYCNQPLAQMCPNPAEMLKECLEAAATRAGWAQFCGGIQRLFGSDLSRTCYAAYLGNKQFRINWCRNAWGG